MDIIEPSSYQRETRLLPGSKERRAIESRSLESLKKELNEANLKADRKTRLVNKGIVVASFLTVAGLILTGDKEKRSKMGTFMRYLGGIIALGAYIKGINSASSKLHVVEPDGSQNTPTKDSLRVSSVRAGMDILKDKGLVDPRVMKNRAKALKYRAPKGSNPVITNEIAKYGRKI
jgi:hypothetical protein